MKTLILSLIATFLLADINKEMCETPGFIKKFETKQKCLKSIQLINNKSNTNQQILKAKNTKELFDNYSKYNEELKDVKFAGRFEKEDYINQQIFDLKMTEKNTIIEKDPLIKILKYPELSLREQLKFYTLSSLVKDNFLAYSTIYNKDYNFFGTRVKYEFLMTLKFMKNKAEIKSFLEKMNETNPVLKMGIAKVLNQKYNEKEVLDYVFKGDFTKDYLDRATIVKWMKE